MLPEFIFDKDNAFTNSTYRHPIFTRVTRPVKLLTNPTQLSYATNGLFLPPLRRYSTPGTENWPYEPNMNKPYQAFDFYTNHILLP